MRSSVLKLLVASGSLALAGCAGAWNGEEQALTVAEAHPITVDSQAVTMTLEANGGELGPMDQARVRAFANAYLANGHGPVSVTTPAGAGAEDAAAAVRKILNETGVSWESMSGAGYIPADGSDKEVILSYTRFVATPSACGVWKGYHSAIRGNQRSPNFGCATQNNLAAMIADPHDLVEPASGGSADAMARIRGVEAYRAGEDTGSQSGDIGAEVAAQ